MPPAQPSGCQGAWRWPAHAWFAWVYGAGATTPKGARVAARHAGVPAGARAQPRTSCCSRSSRSSSRLPCWGPCGSPRTLPVPPAAAGSCGWPSTAAISCALREHRMEPQPSGESACRASSASSWSAGCCECIHGDGLGLLRQLLLLLLLPPAPGLHGGSSVRASGAAPPQRNTAREAAAWQSLRCSREEEDWCKIDAFS